MDSCDLLSSISQSCVACPGAITWMPQWHWMLDSNRSAKHICQSWWFTGVTIWLHSISMGPDKCAAYASGYIADAYTCCGRDHDDVIKWKNFPRYWPFVRGIHWWLVDSPHKIFRQGPTYFESPLWTAAASFEYCCRWVGNGPCSRYITWYSLGKLLLFGKWIELDYFPRKINSWP